jgi:hypothetical protein
VAVVYETGGTVSATDPWDLDLGTHSFTAGNHVVFFYGAHGTGPAIDTIELEVGGVATGTFLTRLDDIAAGSSYWEVWAGVLPSTADTYDLLIDAASALGVGPDQHRYLQRIGDGDACGHDRPGGVVAGRGARDE